MLYSYVYVAFSNFLCNVAMALIYVKESLYIRLSIIVVAESLHFAIGEILGDRASNWQSLIFRMYVIGVGLNLVLSPLRIEKINPNIK